MPNEDSRRTVSKGRYSGFEAKECVVAVLDNNDIGRELLSTQDDPISEVCLPERRSVKSLLLKSFVGRRSRSVHTPEGLPKYVHSRNMPVKMQSTNSPAWLNMPSSRQSNTHRSKRTGPSIISKGKTVPRNRQSRNKVLSRPQPICETRIPEKSQFSITEWPSNANPSNGRPLKSTPESRTSFNARRETLVGTVSSLPRRVA